MTGGKKLHSPDHTLTGDGAVSCASRTTVEALPAAGSETKPIRKLLHLGFLRVGRVIGLGDEGNPEQAQIVYDGVECEHGEMKFSMLLP